MKLRLPVLLAGAFALALTSAASAAGTVESLLKPENKAKLQSILTYHVIPGKVMSQELVKLDSTRTVEGGNIAIRTMNGGVMVDKAHVT